MLLLLAAMAAMLAVTAIPAVALEYGTGSGNGATYGYVVDDGLYVEGGSYDDSGGELWGGIRTDGMESAGWSYNDDGESYTGGYFRTDEMQAGTYALSDGRSAGRFMTGEMDVYGNTDDGNASGHADLGDVCFGSCPQQ